MVETPVLYITFARPEYASQSFAAIKKAQPKKLYFYSNKARDEKPDEVARNLEVRSYINQIDWDCEVKTWFRDEYVEVFTSLWGAIDWVFKNEEKAIIIEEDVVASFAFFDFMDQALDMYKSNEKIFLVSGNNPVPSKSPKGLDAFASRYSTIFGWGSWKNRWDTLDRRMKGWPELKRSNAFKKYWNNYFMRKVQSYYFDRYYNLLSADDTYLGPWDFITDYNFISQGKYCLLPKENLAADIGVAGANHSTGVKSPLMEVTYFDDKYPISRVQQITAPTNFDFHRFMVYRVGMVAKRAFARFCNKIKG